MQYTGSLYLQHNNYFLEPILVSGLILSGNLVICHSDNRILLRSSYYPKTRAVQSPHKPAYCAILKMKQLKFLTDGYDVLTKMWLRYE